MFGRSKEKELPATGEKQISVTTIPMEFFAGANPVIKFRNVEKIVGGTIPTAPRAEKVVARLATPRKAVVGILGNRKILVFGAAGLFMLVIIGAGIYYWRLSAGGSAVKPPVQKQPSVKITPPVVPPPAVGVPVVVPPPPTSTVTAAPIMPSLSGGVIEFPSILIGDSADLDRDGLTDAEEELFTSDAGKPDTDGDSYEDGREINNLYSPIEFAPGRLLSSGLVKEFSNPLFGYKLYYPLSWAVGNVDPEYRDMLFSTLSGENIEVRVFDRASGQTFEDWFAVNAPDERSQDLADFKTVFGNSARMRKDKLVFYLNDADHFYVIAYHVTDSVVVNYRAVVQMVARSFRLSSESNAVLPNQEVVIPPAAVSSTP
ncbi:MAG: hypothetical protein AAB467_00890 [Patescibacteria group bacterium]